jgi:hypothetical protein
LTHGRTAAPGNSSGNPERYSEPVRFDEGGAGGFALRPSNSRSLRVVCSFLPKAATHSPPIPGLIHHSQFRGLPGNLGAALVAEGTAAGVWVMPQGRNWFPACWMRRSLWRML